MSDMATPSSRITFRVPGDVAERLRRASLASGKSESQLLREAVESLLTVVPQGKSAYDLFFDSGLIGTVRDAPSDLSTNAARFEGFGTSQ